LIDAPCSATGTIRRHPDVPWLKGEADLGQLTSLQQRLLEQAASLVKPGGRIVYCVCSLEPEEGEVQIEGFLARNPQLKRERLTATDVFGRAEFLNPQGDLRTLPQMLPDPDPRWGGMDGFFAARLIRTD
jgi:16S rRNA (cytosine967-C5)-methyltransferase